MKKLALKVVGLLAIGSLMSCGGWSSAFSSTGWKSTTIVPQAMRDGVTASTWTIQFGAATTSTPTSTGGTATGPMHYTYVETYGSTSSFNGCVITATCMGTWNETGVSPTTSGNTAMGQIAGTGTTCTCTAASCMNTTLNGTFTSGCGLYADNGGEENYAINNSMLTLTAGDSVAPYYSSGDNYTFVSIPAGM
jgi:hypothetical protein